VGFQNLYQYSFLFSMLNCLSMLSSLNQYDWTKKLTDKKYFLVRTIND